MNTPPLPTVPGGFRVILADPPWRFKSNSTAKPGRNARRHYSTMSLEEIRALPVGSVAALDCALFLCITAPFLAIGAHLPILAAWRFKPSTILTWVKTKRGFDGDCIRPDADLHIGAGLTFRGNAEFVVLGKRGRSVRRDAGVLGTFIAPVRRHSEKPDELFAHVERYSAGPYLELFARRSRLNWISWGDEATKFDPTPDCRASDQAVIRVLAPSTARPRRWQRVGPMTERTRVYRYCRFADLPDALRLGWMVADDFGATHHSAYAVMVVWLCDSEPRWVR